SAPAAGARCTPWFVRPGPFAPAAFHASRPPVPWRRAGLDAGTIVAWPQSTHRARRTPRPRASAAGHVHGPGTLQYVQPLLWRPKSSRFAAATRLSPIAPAMHGEEWNMEHVGLVFVGVILLVNGLAAAGIIGARSTIPLN